MKVGVPVAMLVHWCLLDTLASVIRVLLRLNFGMSSWLEIITSDSSAEWLFPLCSTEYTVSPEFKMQRRDWRLLAPLMRPALLELDPFDLSGRWADQIQGQSWGRRHCRIIYRAGPVARVSARALIFSLYFTGALVSLLRAWPPGNPKKI